MVSSGLSDIDRVLGGDGYPDKSSILIVGPPGIGKEALGYWFTNYGLVQGDFCFYITRLPVRDVIQDFKGFGIDTSKVPLWFASDGGQIRYDVSDLAGLSLNVSEVLKRNSSKRIRIVFDSLSSILMLNPPDAVYRFLTKLFSEIKQYEAIVMATLEEGMHENNIFRAMEQIFDGVIELKYYEDGMKLVPLFRLIKMRGIRPQPGYFNVSFTKSGMELKVYA